MDRGEREPIAEAALNAPMDPRNRVEAARTAFSENSKRKEGPRPLG